MKDSQKLQLRASAIRTRLAEIAGMADDALTAEIRTESDALGGEYGNVETRMRAALIAEDNETKAAETRLDPDAPDAETRAVRELQGRASLSRYLRSFGYGEQLAGAERELAEHRNLPTAGNWLPWDALLMPRPGAELRDDAVTSAPASGNPTNQADIIQRVFARGAVAAVGRCDAGGGRRHRELSGADRGAGRRVRGEGRARKTPRPATVTPNNLEPRRLQARMQFRIEDSMTTTGLESGLQEDLSRAMADQLGRDCYRRGYGAGSRFPGDRGAWLTGRLRRSYCGDHVRHGCRTGGARCRWQVRRFSESECAWVDRNRDVREDGRVDSVERFNVSDRAVPTHPQGLHGIRQCPRRGEHDPVGHPGEARERPKRSTPSVPSGKGLRLIRDEITDADKGLIAVTASRAAQFQGAATGRFRPYQGQARIAGR